MLHVLVEYRGETHNLLLRESGLFAHTGKPCGEVDEITGRRAAALRKLVDHRASGKHGAAQAFGLVVTEHLRQLAYVLDGIIAKVVAESNIDFVSRVNKLLDSLL